MGNATNGDPILRVILVVFAGLLVFGFLFGSNFGGTGQAVYGGHGMAASGGVYFGGMVAWLISFLINILMLVLVFTLIAGLFMGVRKLLIKEDGVLETSRAKVQEARTKVQEAGNQVMGAVNQDPILKTLLTVIAAIAGFYVVVGIFRSFDFVGGPGIGFAPHLLLFALIGFLLKLFMIGLVITLTIALVQFMKNQFFENDQSRQEINVTPTAANQPIQTTPQLPNKPEDRDKK